MSLNVIRNNLSHHIAVKSTQKFHQFQSSTAVVDEVSELIQPPPPLSSSTSTFHSSSGYFLLIMSRQIFRLLSVGTN
ncbi:CLUMA_CG019733, isoform A [Clunio marinus]|uniref:CLUMA_CG019733, isoform A n=1 Tax=Clunio marinus TaxID=568069 RepID=A0A1J1J4B6_9DIPT|nr:CLUMA_CG019733, isoform A [Clunio marinus]